jgi:hypothetical protein
MKFHAAVRSMAPKWAVLRVGVEVISTFVHHHAYRTVSTSLLGKYMEMII